MCVCVWVALLCRRSCHDTGNQLRFSKIRLKKKRSAPSGPLTLSTSPHSVLTAVRRPLFSGREKKPHLSIQLTPPTSPRGGLASQKKRTQAALSDRPGVSLSSTLIRTSESGLISQNFQLHWQNENFKTYLTHTGMI